MPLQTFFSVTPVKPYFYNMYDVEEGAPHANAYFYTYGGKTGPSRPWRLIDQAKNDEIIIGFNAVPTNNQDIWAGVSPYQANTIQFSFAGYNVSTENQYLLIFQFIGKALHASVQFFLSDVFLDMVEIEHGVVEQHAMLLDCPGHNEWVHMWIRLAAPTPWSEIGFHGVDCHLL